MATDKKEIRDAMRELRENPDEVIEYEKQRLGIGNAKESDLERRVREVEEHQDFAHDDHARIFENVGMALMNLDKRLSRIEAYMGIVDNSLTVEDDKLKEVKSEPESKADNVLPFPSSKTKH